MSSTGSSTLTGIGATLAAALGMAAVSTLGDLVWALWIPQHQTIWGLVHGVVVCAAIGVAIGLRHGGGGALGRAVAAELGVGLASAGSFYLLWSLAGWAAMFIAWMLLWILTALVDRWLGGGSWRAAILRGVVAALASGLAFWLISDIWLDPDPAGPNYPWFFACWTFAFLPGFAALFLRRSAAS